MRAERERIARQNRAEGEEQALSIRADADRQREEILSLAYKQAENIKGQGDAESTLASTGRPIQKNPGFYKLLRTLESYKKVLDDKTTAILSSDSELLKVLMKRRIGFEMSTIAPLLEAETAQPVSPSADWSKRRIGIGIAAVWVLSGVYLVGPDQQAVETLFGRVVAPRVMPGLHYALPWPVENVTKLKVRQLQRLVVEVNWPIAWSGRTRPSLSQFLTGDQNIINLRVVVQYSVGLPGDYLFQVQNPVQVIGAAVESEMIRRITHREVDAVLTTEKEPQFRMRLGQRRRAAKRVPRGCSFFSTINIEERYAAPRKPPKLSATSPAREPTPPVS